MHERLLKTYRATAMTLRKERAGNLQLHALVDPAEHGPASQQRPGGDGARRRWPNSSGSSASKRGGK